MINKDLHTTNKVLLAINEKYPVMAWIGCHQHEPNSYVIYEKTPDNEWPVSIDKMNYMATVVTAGDDAVIWNKTKHVNADVLLQCIEFYNETLDFPAWTSNPQYSEDWTFYSQISWYLTEKFHMKCNKVNQTFYIGDDDAPVFSVYVHTSWRDDEANSMQFTIFGTKLFQSFLNAKEACENIGTLYTAAVGHLVKTANECVSSLPDDVELSDCKDLKVWDSSSWSFLSAKDILIEKLEKVLADLKKA